MRTVLIGLAALLYLASGIARAEQHMFLVANDADGYGTDRCLASGSAARQRPMLTARRKHSWRPPLTTRSRKET